MYSITLHFDYDNKQNQTNAILKFPAYKFCMVRRRNPPKYAFYRIHSLLFGGIYWAESITFRILMQIYTLKALGDLVIEKLSQMKFLFVSVLTVMSEP